MYFAKIELMKTKIVPFTEKTNIYNIQNEYTKWNNKDK